MTIEDSLSTEPPVTLDDTPASGTRALDRAPMRTGGRLTMVVYAVALVVTGTAGALYLQPAATPTPSPTVAPTLAEIIVLPTLAPSVTPAPISAPPTVLAADSTLPDADVAADVIAELLQAPGLSIPAGDVLYRQQTAYTIAPARSRSTWIMYTVQLGDTLESIGKRFSVSKDTLAWSNDITYVNRLFPGDTLTVLPEDGVLHRATGQETIQQIADKYKVTPYRIIDSDYNPVLQRADAVPATVLPADMLVMVPGGVSSKQLLYWNPGVTVNRTRTGRGFAGRSVAAEGTIIFGSNWQGTCGEVPNGGGTGTYVIPVRRYEITQEFGSYHGGIDLSARPGTPVFAADSGYVVFAGWSSGGYGNTIVLAHGNVLTLYGHLSSIGVGCGQFIGQGTVIGGVGSTGKSSGSHLHFEVRIYSGKDFVPVNPRSYRSF